MRPSVQKTLLVALGAALLSSALGVSGAKVAATAKDPPVRIVVLPGRAPDAGAGASEVGRLLQEARFRRVLGGLAGSAPAALPGAADGGAAYVRADFVAQVRQRLLAEPDRNGR